MKRCEWNCNIIEDTFSRICESYKIKGVNLKVFNMIKGIKKSKTFAKHLQCEFRCNFDGRNCKMRQEWNIH